MRTVRSIATVHAALLAALGLSSIACGGATVTTTGDGGPPVQPDGGPILPDGGPLPFTCKNPQPKIVAGKDTGYDVCEGGVLRRRAIADCPVLLPRPSDSQCAASVDAGTGTCATDSDCTEHANGTCNHFAGGPGPSWCGCSYGCVRDADCGPGNICVCGDPVGYCQKSACKSGADCSSGGDCATFDSQPGCPGTELACQTRTDECLSNSDCKQNEECTVENGHRVCSLPHCTVGRPFLVEGEARLAPVVSRSDWRASIAPSVDAMAEGTRAELARAWARIGQMEHASVAAFARFALQLLAVGAPPDLIEASQRAMGDETTHARMAFGLASAYAGREVGPGPLSIDACLDACDLEELIVTIVHEGCIGETVAAIEAREALDHARDPAVRGVLETIARDETRHAELAWRTVAWALETGDARVRGFVEAALFEATHEAAEEAAPSPRAAEDLLAHGIVSDAQRRDLRRAAIAHAVLPCARALLARPSHAAMPLASASA
jgi:hypothetical protein